MSMEREPPCHEFQLIAIVIGRCCPWPPQMSGRIQKTVRFPGSPVVDNERLDHRFAWDSCRHFCGQTVEVRPDEIDKVSIDVTVSSGSTPDPVRQRGLWLVPRVNVNYTICPPRTANLRSAGTVNGTLPAAREETTAHTTNGSIR